MGLVVMTLMEENAAARLGVEGFQGSSILWSKCLYQLHKSLDLAEDLRFGMLRRSHPSCACSASCLGVQKHTPVISELIAREREMIE